MKRGLLTSAIAGGLLVAPACGNAQERPIVTIKDCACLWPKPVYGFAAKDNEPERWHPVGSRPGVGAIVSVRNLALGAKAVHGPRRGGRYSAGLGIAVGKDWLKKALGDRRRTASRPD